MRGGAAEKIPDDWSVTSMLQPVVPASEMLPMSQVFGLAKAEIGDEEFFGLQGARGVLYSLCG
jgi:hypothetical protein